MRQAFWKLLFRSNTPSFFDDINFVMFVMVQYLDGVLAYVGVSTGVSSEGNPLAGWLMSIAGVGLGVVILKLVSVGLGILLYQVGAHGLLALVTMLALIVGVIPWIYLFLS